MKIVHAAALALFSTVAVAAQAPTTPPVASQPFRAGRSVPALSVLSSVSAMSRTSRL